MTDTIASTASARPIASVTGLAAFSRLDGFTFVCEEVGGALVCRLGMFIAVDMLKGRIAFQLTNEREARRRATLMWPRANWRLVKHDARMGHYSQRARELARARSGA